MMVSGPPYTISQLGFDRSIRYTTPFGRHRAESTTKRSTIPYMDRSVVRSFLAADLAMTFVRIIPYCEMVLDDGRPIPGRTKKKKGRLSRDGPPLAIARFR